jgi:hypothetical protein
MDGGADLRVQHHTCVHVVCKSCRSASIGFVLSSTRGFFFVSYTTAFKTNTIHCKPLTRAAPMSLSERTHTTQENPVVNTNSASTQALAHASLSVLHAEPAGLKAVAGSVAAPNAHANAHAPHADNDPNASDLAPDISSADTAYLLSMGKRLQTGLKELEWRFDHVVKGLLQNSGSAPTALQIKPGTSAPHDLGNSCDEAVNAAVHGTRHQEWVERERALAEIREIKATMASMRLDILRLSEQVEMIDFKFLVACCVSHHHIQNLQGRTRGGVSQRDATTHQHVERINVNLDPLYIGQLQNVLQQQRKSWQHLDYTQRYIWVMRKIMQRDYPDTNAGDAAAMSASGRSKDGCVLI